MAQLLDEVKKIWEEVSALRKGQEKLWREVKHIRVTTDRLALSLEEEARSFNLPSLQFVYKELFMCPHHILVSTSNTCQTSL